MSITKSHPPASLFDAPKTLPELSVSDLSRILKKTVEDTFGLVRVRGEISECKYHSSGHVYLTLKDEGAILGAVCWKGNVSKLGVKPAVGMDVVCTGRLTIYPGQSKYQMVIEGMTLAGIGAILKMLEERKKKLAAEGLFAPERKRPLPFLPHVIGVLTSPTGAVIRDILHRLADRFPRHVLVWPVAVQGEGAAQQVTAAIDGFNTLPPDGPVPRPDLLIVARGGGSVEDLMAFNEENVVRAVANSRIPVISAVGHETDTTLIDFAADRRAPTPTAAAEMAVPVRDQLLAQVMENGTRLEKAARRLLHERHERLRLTEKAFGDPSRLLEPLTQRLDERAERLTLAWQNSFRRLVSRVAEASGKIRHPRDTIHLATQKFMNLDQRMVMGWRENFTRHHNRLEKLDASLRHLSPRAVLGRGYALIQNTAGHVLSRAADLKKGDALHLEFHDGVRKAVVED